MSEALPERIDLVQAARNASHFAGVVNVAKMHRLVESLVDDSGQIEVVVDLGIDADQHLYLKGHASGEVTMQCQRCLEPMKQQLDVDFLLGMTADEDMLDALPEKYDPVLIPEGTVSLIELIEDELILGIPLVCVHDEQNCEATAYMKDKTQVIEETAKQTNPFAALKDLKLDS